MIWTNLSASSGSSARALAQQNLSLGQFVHVRGSLRWHSNCVTIIVDSVRAHDDPNAESLWWLQLERMHNQVYSKPFHISNVLPESTEQAQSLKGDDER